MLCYEELISLLNDIELQEEIIHIINELNLKES